MPPGREEEINYSQSPKSALARRVHKKVLLPVRHLQQWIEQNVMLILKDAPFDRKDADLVSSAGSCVDRPKRTGPTSTRDIALARVVFCRLEGIDTPVEKSFAAQWLAYMHPCQRFTYSLATGRA